MKAEVAGDQEAEDELTEEQRAAVEEEARLREQLAALKAEGVDLGIEDGEIASIQMRLEENGDTMRQENLIVPNNIMAPIHRDIAIRSGLLPAHDNLLAFAKPEAPNHLKDTASNMTRKVQRNIQPRLTEAQRTLIGADIAERNRQRPPMPKVLNAEERMRNREVIRKMQTKVSFLKNPRFKSEGKPVPQDSSSPFVIIPEVVTFRNYEVGGVFEVPVELRNQTGIGRHVRILPCSTEVFSHTPLRYDGESGITPSSVIAPGMAARFAVRFAPNTLNDQTDELTIRTEHGDFVLPVLARRIQPQLDFEEPVNIGNILAGQHASKTMRVTNHGGEGSFRIVPAKEAASEDEAEHYYETDNNTGLIAFRSPNFHIEPAAFYLEVHQSIELTIKFSATGTGQFKYPVLIEGDNGEKVPLTMIAISDAVRLEVLRWPTVPGLVAPRRPDPHESPWSLVPWQLNWLRPGAQVGCSESQAIELANGGYLPVKVEWRLVEPPKALLSRLGVGGIQRLSDTIMKDMHTWKPYDPSKHGFQSCPFTVSPSSATLAPFSKATFTFAFYAYAPVDHCSTVFAYLSARDLPASRHCLLHYNQLLQLQHMQPSGTLKGLPLFGGAVTPLIDTEPPSEKPKNPEQTTSTCVMSAICLQGRSTGPKVVCLPPLVALSGDVLPFVSHEREIILANTGTMPACFSFRLTSQMPMSNRPDIYDPVWIVGGHEVPPRHNLRDVDPEITDPAEILRITADRLSAQWPPLPPFDSHSATLPGFGALATIAIEPHKGRIQPGQSVKIRLTLRIAQESDVDANLTIDMPSSLEEKAASIVPPVRVRVLAAARAPRVELRGTSFLDYGVVRAHDRHTLKLRLDNPSDMPTIVRLRHRPENKKEVKDVEVPVQLAAEGPPTARSSLSAAPKRQTPRDNPASKLVKAEKGAEDLVEASHEDEIDFHVGSYDDIISMFRQAIHGGDLRGAVPIEDTPEVIVEPWVNARSGCLDKSGRRKHQFYGRGRQNIPEDAPEEEEGEGVGDEVSFIFSPECVALWPHQSVEVDVTLRTHFSEQYNALVEIVAFDSGHSQCIEATAEVQLPRLRLSTQHAHFPVSYVKTHTDPFKIELFNDFDMPAEFHWNVPVKLEACIECQLDKMTGVVPPRSSVQLMLIAVPTREAEHAHLALQVFVKDVMQPLALEVSARVYGPEVDYAVVGEDESAPIIIHKPRNPEDEVGGTYPISVGQAPLGTPDFDFGGLELLKPKKMSLVLYNRTGIPTPFGIKVDKNPAWDPLSKGKKIGGLLEAATRMYAMATTDSAVNNPGGNEEDPVVQTFSAEPHPVAGGRQPSLEPPETKQPTLTTTLTSTSNMSRSKGRRFNPKDRRNQDKKEQTRRWMLDDKHETQAFRNDIGAEFLKQKEVKEQGMVALKSGRGYAVSVEPRSDWLQPFSKATITCVCYSDVPGQMLDELVINIGQLQSHADGGDFRIPMRARSVGNPLFLPEQQVGLNNRFEPPQLLIETITPAAKSTTRTIKVGNNSMSQVRLTWKVLSQLQVQAMEQRRATLLPDVAGNLDEVQEPQQAAEDEEADERLPNEGVEETEGVEGTPREVEAIVETEVAEVTGDENAEANEVAQEGHQDEGDENAENSGAIDEQTEAIEMAEEPQEETVEQAEPQEEEIPQIEDPLALPNGEPPLRIEPVEAILPVQGMATFTVTMMASKATIAAKGNYQYRLVGEGRYTEERGNLRNEEANANAPELTHRPEEHQSAIKRGVAALPEIKLDDNELHDDDSDVEAVPSGRREAEKAGDGEDLSGQGAKRQDEVISTIIVDCTGDCIIPRLTVDKKGDPSVFQFADVDGVDKKEHCAVFKFVHSAVSQPLALPGERHRGPPGVKLGGKVGGMQNQGIAAAMTREVTLNNENSCIVYCQFRIEGPFRIKVVDQVGKKPVFPTVPESTNKRYRHKEVVDALRQVFAVPARCTITVHVEYVPSMVPASEWTHNVEHVFRGDLVVEYPRDHAAPNSITDLQRIHLHATSRKPAIRLDLVPYASLDPPIGHPRADLPPWAEQPPVLVEFGYVHVDAVLARKRVLLLSNQSNVIARWRVFHVGRKRRPPLEIGVTVREDEDFRALDDREAFEFDVSEGELHGPSKDGGMPIYDEDGTLVRGGELRMPNWCPTTPALPKRLQHADEERFEPRKLFITFKPTKNEVYKCRFRVQVEEGRSVDFICRGTGSYDEEDDAMDFQEA